MEGNAYTRRRLLAGVGAAGIASLAGCSGGQSDGNGTESTDTDTDTATDTNGTTVNQTASGTVSIGVLQPVSGDLSYYGQQSLWGFYQGLKRLHAAGGDGNVHRDGRRRGLRTHCP